MNRLLLFGLIFVTLGCNHTNDNASLLDPLKALGWSDTDINFDEHYFIVIPGQGCPSCIYRAEEFMKSRYWDEKKYTFVFTNFDSEKLLQIKFGQEVLNKSNVLLDKTDLVYRNGFNGMYPVIVQLKNDQMTKEYGSPDNEEIWKKIAF